MVETLTLALDLILERRRSTSPWQRFSWRAVAVEPAALPPLPQPTLRVIETDGGRTRFRCEGLALTLHSGETEHYLHTITAARPMVFVVLRGDPATGIEPLLATASAGEAQAFGEGCGETVIDTVPMPPTLQALLAAFVERHRRDAPFIKRQRVPATTDAGRPRGAT